MASPRQRSLLGGGNSHGAQEGSSQLSEFIPNSFNPSWYYSEDTVAGRKGAVVTPSVDKDVRAAAEGNDGAFERLFEISN